MVWVDNGLRFHYKYRCNHHGVSLHSSRRQHSLQTETRHQLHEMSKKVAPSTQPLIEYHHLKFYVHAMLSDLQGILERLNEGVVVGDGGFVFALEKRGYVKAGPCTPEASVEHPEAGILF